MGAIALRIGSGAQTITGAVTVEDAKLLKGAKLYHRNSIGPIAGLTDQQILDAVAVDLALYFRRTALQQLDRDLQAQRQAETAAEYDTI